MSKLSMKSLRTHFFIGGGIFLAYLLLGYDATILNRVISGLFLGGLIPFAFGLFRFVRGQGTFDLFIYTHRKLWKYGKNQEKFEEENEKIAPESTEKLGSYYDYLTTKETPPSCREPLLAGGIYMAVSILLVLVTL